MTAEVRETGTVRRGDGKRYPAIRVTRGRRVTVTATRGFGPQEPYFGTTGQTAATFEPDRLTMSGPVTP